jgi:hypothetical protein
MNTEFRFLQQLDEDLAEAARAESSDETAPSRGGEPPRRLPRRGGAGRHWGQLVAATVAILVLAGSIGFFAQGGSSDDSGGSDQAGLPAVKEADDSRAQATTVPGVAPVPDLGQGQGVDGPATTLTGDERASLNYASAGDAGNATGGRTLDAVGQVPTDQQDLSKIVRDGRIEVEVANGEFDANVTAVSRIATNNGGFVLTSSTQNGQTGTFTLRIPAKRFDMAMNQLRELGTVKSDQITGQDVTAEFIDLQARLQILTDRRDLLRDLQAKATSSGEILRFATLIDNVQFEIEKIQGNLNFIKDQVAEATIRVSLREQDAPDEEQPSDVDAPSLSEAFDYATQGFMRVLGAVVVGLGYLIPIGILVLLGWLVFRVVRRRDRERS